MTAKFLLVLYALCYLSQVNSLALTKEFNLAQETELQSSREAFSSAITALSDSNVRKEVVSFIFKTPEATVTNLAELLSKTNNPEVAEVLDAFNYGLGSKLLVIDQDYVQIDARAFEKLLTQNAKVLARTLYPNDYFQQLVAFGLFQRQLQEVNQVVSPVINSQRIPVERFAALLSQGQAISNRAVSGIQQKDLISDVVGTVVGTVETAVCNTVVATVYNTVNSTLNTYLAFLETIAVGSSDNILLNVVGLGLNLVLDLGQEAIVTVSNLVKTLSGTICSNLFNPAAPAPAARRRRDLTETEFDFNRIKRDTAVAAVADDVVPGSGNLLTGLLDLVLGLLSPILNVLLTTVANNVITSFLAQISAFVQDVVLVQVDIILRANEYTHEFKEGSVKSYDSNQLPSNNPIEDTRSEASCLLTTGFLVGVFDGHGGGACAQVIAKRLFNYITACLLPHENLLQYVLSVSQPKPPDLLQSHNDKVQFVEDVRDIYKGSFIDFIKELAEEGYNQNFEMSNAIQRAFLRLDDDLSKEAMPKGGLVNMKTLSVAMSGAVSCVAHIDGPHLHVANVGDCCAVLGSLSDTNSWVAKKLTEEHNSYNQAELERIFADHPAQEKQTVIKMDRLLGQLAPLRAMGDFRFKWSKEIMADLVVKNFGEQMIPPNYHTPPYLTAKPDVTYHRLTARDKFLIIATDGLWDCLTPLQAIRLVGEHMKGKVTLHALKLPRKNMKLDEINDMLLQRKEGLKIKPKDSNASTHIIRNALGGTEFGIDHSKISQLLTLPDDVVRVFRDDITVTIVYFDTEFLRHCPA